MNSKNKFILKDNAFEHCKVFSSLSYYVKKFYFKLLQNSIKFNYYFNSIFLENTTKTKLLMINMHNFSLEKLKNCTTTSYFWELIKLI